MTQPDTSEPWFKRNTDPKAFFERIARLKEEQKQLTSDIADVWAEAKTCGHDVKAMKRAYSLWALEREDRVALGVYVDQMEIFG